MTTLVPAPAKVPITGMARVSVLKLQDETAAPLDVPLPVALVSFPLTGSTK